MPKIVKLLTMTVVFSIPLFAQHSDWEISTMNGGRIVAASLLDLEGDSLDVSSPDFNGKLDVGTIEELRRGRSHVLDGVAFGFVAGAVVGYYIGSKDEGTTNYAPYYSSSSETGDKKISSLFIGGAIGGAGGGLIGALSGRQVLSLKGKNQEEKYASLRKILLGEHRPHKPEDSNQRDIVYLKNGSIIRGAVVELVPDSTVKILTVDSSVFVFRMAEVSRISKENVPGSMAPKTSATSASQDSLPPVAAHRFSFGINVGAGFPVGAFGETSGNDAGAAKSGFAIGADVGYGITPNIDWLTSAYFSFHALNLSGISSSVDIGSWFLVWPMTGIRVISGNRDEERFFAIGQVGLLAETTPEVNSTSFSARSIAFSFGVGGIFNQRLTLQARYLYGNPEYEISILSGNS